MDREILVVLRILGEFILRFHSSLSASQYMDREILRNDRIFRKKTQIPKCPECGSDKVLPIVWGFESIEDRERYYRGEIWLGGCTFYVNSSTHACFGCRTEFIDPVAIIERTNLIISVFGKDKMCNPEFLAEMEQLVAEYEAKRIPAGKP